MKSSTMLKSAVAAGAFAVAGVATANADTITVQAGDTLSKLANANGTTVDALAKANGISNPNLIFVGQQLQTQGAANAAAPAQPAATQQAASAAAANGTYTVKAGDTLNRIAVANGTSVAALAAANGIQNINLIAVGQVLKLSAAATSAPAQPAVPAQQEAPAQQAASGSVPDDVKYIAAADTNRDGFMTAAEYLAYQANGGATATPAQPASAAAPAIQMTQVSTGANSAVTAMLNSLNAMRASLGLNPVTLDAGLSSRAQARAYNAVTNGGLPTDHFRTNGEVVAIGYSFSQVISAWYNEQGMMTNGTPGHRMWVANPRATSVGFGVVGDTIVAESNVGQY